MATKQRSYTIIPAETPMPADLTQAHCLMALYELQQWEAFALNYREPLDPNYFFKHVMEFLRGLDNTTRLTAFKHISAQTCIVCGSTVDLGRSSLDHVIPRARGGPDSVQNSLVLCRVCNSSKGTKDLLEWWLWKGYAVADLPRTVLCLYARVVWQFEGEQTFTAQPSLSLHAFLHARASLLPTDGHRIALYGAAFAACAVAQWLRERSPHD
jgi:HNH endonuclease